MDLVGMEKSAKPDLEYTFFEHVKYVEGFIEALGLKNITGRTADLFNRAHPGTYGR